MSTFDQDETGVATSQPREFIQITHAATNYYISCGDRDLVYEGITYSATPSARMDLGISPSTSTVQTQVLLPVNHPYVQRFMSAGSPPQLTTVTIRRLQLTSGQVEQIWTGYVQSLSIEKHTAKFAVPSRISLTLERVLPTVLIDITCGNILYDGWCQQTRTGFGVTTTVTARNGAAIDVASMGGNVDHWAQNGEILHIPSGERMTLIDQVGVQLTLQKPIAEINYGDAVTVYAGCDHTIATCKAKFNNVLNFKGLPQRPTHNLWKPGWMGILVST